MGMALVNDISGVLALSEILGVSHLFLTPKR